ncbi:MAG TPA: PIN domain-containing protein [Sphingomonas sp.]|nr:PIN domain-containing protein [Sphingomonas sp.]
MILVDSSVWIDHLRGGDPILTDLLNVSGVLAHPFVTGELALGSFRNRDVILGALRGLPQAIVAQDPEVSHLIEQHRLFGLGIGYVDAHLLASVKLTPDASLWTRDRRLHEVAARLGVATEPARAAIGK